jgi:hypothetical protein
MNIGMKNIKDGADFAIYNWNSKFDNLSDPIDLLETYDGWDGWCIISEEEYNELQKGITEK